MSPVSEAVRAFVQDFERASNSFEPDLLEPLLSDPVVGSDPQGRIQVLGKAEFLAGTKDRQAALQPLGFQFVKLDPLEETPIGRHYMMVKTHGTMRLEQVPGQPIDLVHDSIYILYIGDGSPKMVFTLSHEHPVTMLVDQGFAPADPG